MDFNKPRSSSLMKVKLPNGYVLPQGRVTPNALFVGGIDTRVNDTEMRDCFARYGTILEVKIITYRGGLCKGYAFVYFSEDVNIQSIVDQQISLNGRKLKLGPAIMKERGPRSSPSQLVGPVPWVSPSQYYYCACCAPIGAGMTHPSPVFSQGSPYSQPYSYSNFGGFMMPQMSLNYQQNGYAYQNYVDSGVQTMLTVV